MIERIARCKNARQPQRFKRVRDEPFSERGRVPAPMMCLRENPTELDVVGAQITTRSVPGETDHRTRGFQAHGSKTKSTAGLEVVADKLVGLVATECAFV